MTGIIINSLELTVLFRKQFLYAIFFSFSLQVLSYMTFQNNNKQNEPTISTRVRMQLLQRRQIWA